MNLEFFAISVSVCALKPATYEFVNEKQIFRLWHTQLQGIWIEIKTNLYPKHKHGKRNVHIVYLDNKIG